MLEFPLQQFNQCCPATMPDLRHSFGILGPILGIGEEGAKDGVLS